MSHFYVFNVELVKFVKFKIQSLPGRKRTMKNKLLLWENILFNVEIQYDSSQWDSMSDQHVFCDVAFTSLMWIHVARLLADLATGWSQFSELGSRTQDSPLGKKRKKNVEEF